MWGDAQRPRRKAFVLGIADYANCCRLNNTVRDAVAIADALRQLGFSVTEHHNLDFAGLFREVSVFLNADDGGGSEPCDVVIFFAGHGLQLGGENFIVPRDFDPQRTDWDAHLLSVQWLLEQMGRRPGRRLLFLDACRDTGGLRLPRATFSGQQVDAFLPADAADSHDGRTSSASASGEAVRSQAERLGPIAVEATAAGRTRSLSGQVENGLARPSLAHVDQTFIAFAADPGATAKDGADGAHSPFTQALLRYLDWRGLDVFDMCQFVARDVREATGGSQVPWTNSSLLDQFEFQPADNEPTRWLTAGGFLAGVLTAVFSFELISFSELMNGHFVRGNGRLYDIGAYPQYLLTSLFFGFVLGAGAYAYARPKAQLRAFVIVSLTYALIAMASRLLLAYSARLDSELNLLSKVDNDTLTRVLTGHLDLADKGHALLVAILFFAIVGGVLTGIGSVASGAYFSRDLRQPRTLLAGGLIGMLAPVLLISFMAVREKVGDLLEWDPEVYGDGVVGYGEIPVIIVLVGLWQGLMAFNVGRAYAKPQYRNV